MNNLDLQIDILTTIENTDDFSVKDELFYLLEGNVELVLSGKTYSMEVQDIIYVNSSELHFFRKPSSDLLLCRIRINPALLSIGDNKQVSIWCNSPEDTDTVSYEMIRKCITDILQTLNYPEMVYQRMSLYYHLLDLLLTHHRGKYNREHAQLDLITQIRRYVEQNYSENLNLQTLSRVLHYSEAHLSRLIKKSMGLNYTDYVHNVRTMHAREQLIHTDKQIARIALDCGFMSSSALYKLFQNNYGMSPSEYRKNHQLQPEENQKVEQRLLQYLGIIKKTPNEEASENIQIHVDSQRIQSSLPATWNHTINVGRLAQYITMSKNPMYFQLLNHLWPQHLRFTNLFDRSLVTPVDARNGVYNYSFSIDEAIQDLIQNHQSPFFRIESWNVQKGSKNDHDMVFSSREEYETAIQSFLLYISSLNFHYTQLTNWIFELWEPDDSQLNDEYFSTFGFLQNALSTMLPGAKLGGSGSRIGQRLGIQLEVIEKWKQSGYTPAFLSVSFYPYSVHPDHMQKYIVDADILPKEISRLKQLLNENGLSELPLYVTEWNAFGPGVNYFNDSLWKANYMVKAYADTIGLVDAIIHTTFIDPPSHESPILPLRGEAGWLTNSMLRKPSYFVSKIFRTMGDHLLENQPGCILSSNGPRRMQIVLYHNQVFSSMYYQQKEVDLKPELLHLYLQPSENKHFELDIGSIDNGIYQIETYHLTKSNGSILDRWVQKDFIHSENKYRLLALALESEIDVTTYSITVRGNHLKLNFILPASEILSINIMKR